MSMVNRLLDQLEKRGLSIRPGEKPGELKLYGPRSEATPEIMRALTAYKGELLKRFALPGQEPAKEFCKRCNRDVTDPEDRERLEGVNPFCDQSQCPYRKRS